MSRFSAPSGRSLFASKAAYDALGIESGEESEEEVVQEEPAHAESIEKSVKPSKSAIKKAKELARLERKQQQKEKQRASRAAGSATPPVVQVAQESPLSDSVNLPTSAPDAGVLSQDSPGPTTSDLLPEVPAPVPTAAQPPASVVTKPVVGEVILSHSESDSNGNSRVHVAEVQIQKDERVDVPEPAPVKEVTEPKPKSAPVPIATSRPPQPTEEDQVKKRQNVLERVIWTFIMIFGFIALLLMGHSYMIVLVMLCQTLVYREVTALFSLKSASSKDKNPELKGKDPWSKTLNWYFFAVTNYFLYGESIIYYFKHVVFADAQLLPFATNHRMISFTLYIIGFMGFVMSLKKGYLKQQFGLFCWVHMSLLIIVFSSHFIVNNILEGLIWFWVPASLVICNDCFAYIWGKTIGRTPLIKLSPKKTVEGFIGAFWSTLIFAVLWGTYFMRFQYMICPVHDLGVNAFTSIACKPNAVFVWRSVEIWKPLSVLLSPAFGHSITSLSYAPYQLHLLVLACFASLVAPFGGFFASGFKRAFDIKDFGQSIPGHGGMTDRMDCQFLMGVFTYVYYSSLIRETHVTVGSVLQTIVSGLTVGEQLELISDLTRYLQKQGISIP
ncbi:phosphatidate cytidylyltransferase [Coprinopsis marcescibilis]|uniref:Phosphatidate cytidylyltransferase n=1 Tax=Coprinopsis marcescibilis TaxID=230819 RepID=A0A5C3KQ49_COPMA|nr:phosphatidate cytidylyltransferase [Coprinopsis marcescibilis]